jgi:hypothetical protein
MIIFEEMPVEQGIVSCASIDNNVEAPMETDTRTVVMCSSKNEIELCNQEELPTFKEDELQSQSLTWKA